MGKSSLTKLIVLHVNPPLKGRLAWVVSCRELYSIHYFIAGVFALSCPARTWCVLKTYVILYVKLLYVKHMQIQKSDTKQELHIETWRCSVSDLEPNIMSCLNVYQRVGSTLNARDFYKCRSFVVPSCVCILTCLLSASFFMFGKWK